MQDTIRRLKQQVDVVIVQIQSGFEDTHEASPRSIKGLRAAADAGADLVGGHGISGVIKGGIGTVSAITVYNVVRNGGWYQFGFLIGAGSPVLGLFSGRDRITRHLP
jgi:Bacterial capsule synthesis protein PGA_cap